VQPSPFPPPLKSKRRNLALKLEDRAAIFRDGEGQAMLAVVRDVAMDNMAPQSFAGVGVNVGGAGVDTVSFLQGVGWTRPPFGDRPSFLPLLQPNSLADQASSPSCSPTFGATP
jgi:hypothetical protein